MANRVEVQFGASIGELKSAVDQVNSSLDTIKGHVEGVASAFVGLAGLAGAALSFEGLKSSFNDLAAFADQIMNAQARMGGTLEDMTTLSGVAKLTGVAFQGLTGAVAAANLQVQRSTTDAYGPAAQGLKSLGLSAKELQGLPVDQWFMRVSDAVSRYNPSLTLTSNVQQAFGRGMADLMPLLLEGSDHYRELQGAVQKAQQGLSAALPGISETADKLNVLKLQSQAFAAQVFTALKPAIDAAIGGFSALTQSITVDDIRDAANAIANALIEIAASVARFFAQIGMQIDILKSKMNVKFSLPKEDDEMVRTALTWMAKLSGNYGRLKETLSKPIAFNLFGDAGSEDPTLQLAKQFLTIETYAKRAHDAVSVAIPHSGSWEALSQDLARINSETLSAAESFTKLNAASANNGAKSGLRAQATEIETAIAAERSRLAQTKEILNQEASSYRITEQQKALYTETAIAQAYQAEMALMAQKERLYQGDAAKYAEVEREKAKLTAAYQQDMLKTVDAAQKQMTASIQSGLQSFTSSVNAQFQGLMSRTTSWAQAGINVTNAMFMKLIEMGQEWAIKRIASIIADSVVSKTTAATDVVTHASAEAAKTEATLAGTTARAGAEATGATASLGTHLANAVTSVGIDAGKVFAGVFGFLAPVMGPAAAGPAAASEAEALAGGLTPLAVGAWEVANVMPALLHPGEMVLPQTFASGLRANLSGGGGGAGGGGGSVFAPNFSGFIGTQAMINQIMPQLAKAFRSYQTINPSAA